MTSTITLSDGSYAGPGQALAAPLRSRTSLTAIDSANSHLTATLAHTGAITISDSTSGCHNLTVAECSGSTAATDLGIAGTGSGASLTGSPISCGSVTFYASTGNDTMKGGTGSTNSLVETWDANMTLSRQRSQARP